MTTIQVRVPDVPTNPAGLPTLRESEEVRDIRAAAVAVDKALMRTASRLDASDPDFDAVADIAASDLLRAGAVLDVLARRHERAMSRGPQASANLGGN